MRMVAVVMLAVGVLSAPLAAIGRADEGSGGGAASAAGSQVTRAECVNACGEEYKVCVQRYEAKQPGRCGTAGIRCRAACPPKVRRAQRAAPQPAVVAPARDELPDAQAPANVAPAPASPHADRAVDIAPPAGAPPPRRETDQRETSGNRVDGVPANEPATTREDREVTPTARRPPAEPPAAASKPVTASAAAPPVNASADPHAGNLRAESSDTAVESVPADAPGGESPRRRRNWLQAAWCSFQACEDDEDEPPTCPEACSADYHDCVTIGTKQRQQYCSTDLAHCRERCVAGEPASRAR